METMDFDSSEQKTAQVAALAHELDPNLPLPESSEEAWHLLDGICKMAPRFYHVQVALRNHGFECPTFH